MRAASARSPMRVAATIAVALAVAPASGQAAAQKPSAADEVDRSLAQYRRSSLELERLQTYNGHVEALLQDQQRALRRLAGERESARSLRRDLLPLLTRMVDDLARFVEADLPIRAEQRRGRVASLREALGNARLSVAEKFRRVVEAYQAELDLGRKIGTYRGEVERGGVTQAVNFLHLGRVLLAYQSEDRSVNAFWDASSEPPGWQDLPDSYRAHLDEAMRVADRQAAPVLIRVPVPAPEPAR